MTRYALIENDSVREIIDVDGTPQYHPDMLWVEVPRNVEENWEYNHETGQFSEPQTFEPEILVEPDPAGFLLASIDYFGAKRSGQIDTTFPHIYRGIEAGTEVGFQIAHKIISQIVGDEEGITEEEYEDIRGLWRQYNLPEFD